ncbi:TerC family protein [Pontibacter sp. G13]|uniref:TerC family protein n=1 Tax=Pontibacter sp. G13 TaxID=3074898 RepID=UPI00288C6127|nr:TerC family protein [Pontibacter sp. G13]WNJ21041.1 TerC family protein [Pontibacter sp. G13]
MEAFTTLAGWTSLISLTLMEIVLNIDNIVFISIIASRLPKHQQPRVRTIGLLIALGVRIGLLFTISWLMTLTDPVFTVDLWGLLAEPIGFSEKDLILLAGGLFLMGKSVSEMHQKLEGHEEARAETQSGVNQWGIIAQIVLIDMVFSVDSILTAVGLTKVLAIMIVAEVLAMTVMIAFAGPVARFINSRPTMKILALSFLILIGFMLVLEGLHQHINKGYIYFGMAFAFIVEMLNSRVRAQNDPVELHNPRLPEDS